jgi:hypothetical protein
MAIRHFPRCKNRLDRFDAMGRDGFDTPTLVVTGRCNADGRELS